MTKQKEKSPSVLAHPSASFNGSSGLGTTDYIIETGKSQYTEFDELADKFKPKKVFSCVLSDSYNRLGNTIKSSRVASCGHFLDFAHEIDLVTGDIADKGKLYNASFCRDRLCPMCAWRKSLKLVGQLSQILDVIGNDYEFIFLTLTVPNCDPEYLKNTLDNMFSGWIRFNRFKSVKKVVKGYFRSLEITRNAETGQYHPHFHCIIAVPRGYFKSRDYIKQSEWLEMWRSACKNKSIKMVNVKKCKPKNETVSKLNNAVVEVAKYSLKGSDFLYPDNDLLTDKTVDILSKSLFNRRLVAFGGCFKEQYKKLNLEDIESNDTDLTHINETINSSVALLINKFGWSYGVYKFIGSDIIYPNEKGGD